MKQLIEMLGDNFNSKALLIEKPPYIMLVNNIPVIHKVLMKLNQNTLNFQNFTY